MDPHPTIPERRDRRKDDPRLEQILELTRAQSDVLNSLVKRISIVEREIATVRRLREEVGLEDMSREQRRSVPELIEWWMDTKDKASDRRSRTEEWARWGTIFSGLSAAALLAFALLGIIHH